MPQEQSLKEVLQAASGDLLQAIHATARGARDRFDDLARDLAALHNEGTVDAVAAFAGLKNSAQQNHEFFLTRHVFEKALPQLQAPVERVMGCVLALCREAGRDLAAGTILNAFTAFCVQDPPRADEAMRLILADPAGLAEMIAAVAVAQSTVAEIYDPAPVLDLACHSVVEVRQHAVFAIGRIRVPATSTLPQVMLAALEEAQTRETNDHVLAAMIDASLACLIRDPALQTRAVMLIDAALGKGQGASLHAAAGLLWLRGKEIPSSLRRALLPHLLRVEPQHTGTLDQLDHGLAMMLTPENPTDGLQFLETLLVTHDGRLLVESLRSTISEIQQSPALLATVITRWFLSGRKVLCEAIPQIVQAHRRVDLPIDIDEREIPRMDFVHLVFIARKAIGYLFMAHVAAASIVVTLMHHAPDEETLDALAALLIDPLLLNYPGSTREYLERRSARTSEPVRHAIDKALAAIAGHLGELAQIPVLNALQPGPSQRETHRRQMAESMATAMKAAERDSVFLNLFSRSTLLYGHKSISYIHTGESEPRRIELPLTSHSVSMEFPRMEILDPYGLDFTLRVFRVERLDP
ncbi:hypothetical protein SRS16CHR_00609 [Variovorax sp. SRS16]|uniref:hypothetical protein n=1 Tax=Variovorax sp. SRS16 TaxID=282217 RepID=UPI001315E9AC|nr:hypothetical protein [Variovorax sp. SRS16]VTU13475.1 hypothetical protein SRS16CHR_00609 [Variovorax sp. SRS16]